MDSTITEAEHNDKHFIFSTKNFHSICRICFSNTKEDLQDLNLSKYENESLRNVLDSCSIHLASSQSELLPSNICMMCLKAVLQFRSFRDQLKQSNTMLKLVHDYLYNDQKPKKTSKFITISYKEYPSAEKLLNKCDLVPMYNNNLKVEQQPYSDNRTPPIIPTTEDFTDLFNLKVLQPVSNDVPTVIFNEHHHHDNNHHDNYYTLEQVEQQQQLDEDIPLEYHITSEDNVVLTRSFGQQPQQQQTQMSISVSDSECNLLERIMQVTNVKDEKHKTEQQQQKQQQRKKSNSSNSTRKKQQNQRIKPTTMNIHSELYIKDEVDSDDNSYGWFNVLNTNAIKQNRIKGGNIVGNNSKKFRKKWDCKQCCRSFRNFVLFSHHIAEDHREYYKCEICQKEFTSSTTFLRHKRLHN